MVCRIHVHIHPFLLKKPGHTLMQVTTIKSIHHDRSTASVVLAAGGRTTRLLAGARGCTASSLAGEDVESMGSELSDRPRGRAIRAMRMCGVCLSLSPLRAHCNKCCKKIPKTEKNKTKYDILGKVRGAKDQPTDQRTNDNMLGPVSFSR